MAVEKRNEQPNTATLAPPPTQEEVRAANALEYAGETGVAERVGKNKVGRALLATAEVAVGVGVSGAGAKFILDHVTPPAVHRPLDDFYHKALQSLRIERTPVIPSIFDPNAIEGFIGDNNILRGVSLETVQNAPQFDNEGNPLFLMFTPKEGAVSRFEKKLVAPGVLPDILEEVKSNNIKDTWRQTIAANATVPMPLDGWVFLMVIERGGKPIFTGVTVEFMTPNNTLDFVNIDTDDIRAEALVDAPIVSKENGFGKDYKKGLFLKRGEKDLFRPLVDTIIDYMRQSGEGGTLATNRRIPGEIKPLTLSDPTTGEQKLPELAKQ